MVPGLKSTFVKICGITRLADAQFAVASGADAVGFVFAPSPRRISIRKAQEISESLDPSVQRIGVFVDATDAEISATVQEALLSGAQLHGRPRRGLVRRLKKAKPDLVVVQAVRVDPVISGSLLPSELSEWLEIRDADLIMLDSKDVSAPAEQSTPIPLDWLKELSLEQFIVAGGLTPETVAPLIVRLHPWGVDVSAGVEESPGRKDPSKVAAFVKAVRRAEAAS